MNGLEQTYPELKVYALDAAVSENEALQTELGLRGHPSVALLDAEGQVTNRYFGLQTAETMDEAVQNLLAAP